MSARRTPRPLLDPPNGYPGAITAATPTQINVFVPDWLSRTGEGSTNPQLVWDDLNISTPYSSPTEPATVNGQPAEILYLGAAPGQPAGIFQLNVRISTGAPP